MDKVYRLLKDGKEVYQGTLYDCTHQYSLGLFKDKKSLWVIVDYKGNVINRNKKQDK